MIWYTYLVTNTEDWSYTFMPYQNKLSKNAVFFLVYVIVVIVICYFLLSYQAKISLNLLEKITDSDIRIVTLLLLLGFSIFLISNIYLNLSNSLNNNDGVRIFNYGGQLFAAFFSANTLIIATIIKSGSFGLTFEMIKKTPKHYQPFLVAAFMAISVFPFILSVLLSATFKNCLNDLLFSNTATHNVSLKFSSAKESFKAAWSRKSIEKKVNSLYTASIKDKTDVCANGIEYEQKAKIRRNLISNQKHTVDKSKDLQDNYISNLPLPSITYVKK